MKGRLKQELHKQLLKTEGFALAEDKLRYAGQNGIRFHRMVVRALHQVPAASVLGTSTAAYTITFQPASLDRDQAAYLADYEIHNDRFGAFHFPVRSLPIHPDHLALVAWVQDPLTKRILQAAFAGVSQR